MSHTNSFSPNNLTFTGLFFLVTSFWLSIPTAYAHGISEQSRETMLEGSLADYVWLGAEHMLTGYDHLLFLFGVLFFLRGFTDVVRFITAFTIGHCITLLGATLAGISANAYLIDAVIALSVLYKGFENLKGFEKVLSIRAPNLLTMVFIFGLIHGFGLSTRLQEITLGNDGMIGRILAFNVGVELGQVVALTIMIGVFAVWRKSKTFEPFSTAANIGLSAAGIGLFVIQLNGYFHERSHSSSAPEHSDSHGHHDDHHDDHTQGHHSTDKPAEDPKPSPPIPEEKSEPAQEDTPHHEPASDTNQKAKEQKAEPKGHHHKKKHSHEHSHGDGKKHRH